MLEKAERTPLGTTVEYSRLALDAARLAEHQLGPDSPDDRILGAILAYRGEYPGRTIYVATRDSGFRIGARALGLDILTLPPELELGEQLDEQSKKIRTLETELAKLRAAQPQLSLAFRSPPTPLSVDKELASLSNRKESEMERLPSAANAPGLIKTPFGIGQVRFLLDGETNQWFPRAGEAERREYDALRDKYLEEYELFLANLTGYLTALSRLMLVRFVIVNSGNATATDVQATIIIPNDWKAFHPEAVPDPPTPPIPPVELKIWKPKRDPSLPRGGMLRTSGLTLTDEVPQSVEIWTRPEAIHAESEYAVAFDVALIGPAGAKGLNLDYTIAATDLPQLARGTLRTAISPPLAP